MDNLIDTNNNIKHNNKSNLCDINNSKSYTEKEENVESEYEDKYRLKLEDLKEEYYPIYPNSINGYITYFDIHRYLLSKKADIRYIIIQNI